MEKNVQKMKIINRYIIREFVKPLVFSTVVFGGLVLISEFFRDLNYYLEKKAVFTDVFIYLFLNLPWWTIQVLPVSVLLAVLFSLGALARQGEITAIKAAGINLWRIISILLLCGFIIGAGELFLREKIIPHTVQMAEKVKKEKIQKENSYVQTEYKNLVIYLPPNGRMTVGRLDAAHNMMEQIVIDYYDENFNLTNQVLARESLWQDAKWLMHGGLERFYKGNSWHEKKFDFMPVILSFSPQDFIIIRRRPEQMTTKEYIQYIHQLETMGIPAEKDKIQFHLRWSSVFSHIVVMLIGIPFAIGMGARHGKIISFSFALIFAFIYWGFQAVGQSLGESRIVSPMFAAWIGNFIFGSAGLVMIGRIKK